jgi:hypothetical protein
VGERSDVLETEGAFSAAFNSTVGAKTGEQLKVEMYAPG